MSTELINPESKEAVMHRATSTMWFFAASTNAINEAYGFDQLNHPILSPAGGVDIVPDVAAFMRLVETVFSYPHPMCLAWALSATQAYEGLSGYEDQWEWPTEMMLYGMEEWYPLDAMP